MKFETIIEQELGWTLAPEAPQPMREEYYQERRTLAEQELTYLLETPLESFGLLDFHGKVHKVQFVPIQTIDPVIPVIVKHREGWLWERAWQNEYKNLVALYQEPFEWNATYAGFHSFKWDSWQKDLNASIKSLVVKAKKVIKGSELQTFELWLAEIHPQIRNERNAIETNRKIKSW